MERRVGAVVDDGAVGRRGLALGIGGGDHDAGRAYLALDVAVLVEAPVDEVLVVRDGDVARDHHAPLPADLGTGHRIVVLPEDGVVLLV